MALMTVKEAAGYTRLSKSTLDSYRVAGGGPLYIKIGGKVLYDTADLDAWLEDHKQTSTAQNRDSAA